MRFNRYLPLLVPLATLFLFELFYFFPGLIYVSLVLIVLMFFFAFRQFVLASNNKEKIWSMLALPILFAISVCNFSILIPNQFLVQLIYLLSYFFFNFYFRSAYRFLLHPAKYQKNSLENFSSYGNFLAVYFMASGVYGLQSFLSANTWLIMFFLLMFVAIAVYQVFSTNGILNKNGYLFLAILPLLLIEIAWTISFLSLSFYILGLILAVCYYISIGLTRFYLIGKWEKQVVKLYLIFGFLSIFLVLLTARWI